MPTSLWKRPNCGCRKPLWLITAWAFLPIGHAMAQTHQSPSSTTSSRNFVNPVAWSSIQSNPTQSNVQAGPSSRVQTGNQAHLPTSRTQVRVPWGQVESTHGFSPHNPASEEKVSSRQTGRATKPGTPPGASAVSPATTDQIPWNTLPNQDTSSSRSGLEVGISSRVKRSMSSEISKEVDRGMVAQTHVFGHDFEGAGQAWKANPDSSESSVEWSQIAVDSDLNQCAERVGDHPESIPKDLASIPWEMAVSLHTQSDDSVVPWLPDATKLGMIETLEPSKHPDQWLASVDLGLVEEPLDSPSGRPFELTDNEQDGASSSEHPGLFLIESLSEPYSSVADTALPMQGVPTLMASHSSNRHSSGPVQLNQITSRSSHSSTSEPIGVLPIARLTRANTSQEIASSFSTGKYTGPMAPAEELFLNLDVKDEFQFQNGESLQVQRTSSDQFSSNYTWAPGHYTWASPSFDHRPLYFEQPNLERYGMGSRRCMQPLFSGMHFFGSIALMPYKVLTQHPNERVYSLGNQRPGDRACYQGRSLLGQSQVGEVCRYWDEYSGYQ